MSSKDNPLIIALDLKWSDALDLAKSLDPNTCRLKIGSQLFTSVGPESVRKLNSLPLITHAILQARGSKLFNKIVISSDSKKNI